MSTKQNSQITRFKGHISVTEHMYEILTTISAKKKEEQEGKSSSGYLLKFVRLVDPVIIASLYGLYKSKLLPPLELDDFPLEKSYEFGNIDISDFADKLNHFLFCLWVKENGLPNQKMKLADYREKLYRFTSKIISEHYFINVVVPFYAKQADDSNGEKTSFVHRLLSSDNVAIINEMYTPEYLAAEFDLAQTEFVNDVIIPASHLQGVPAKTELDACLTKDEDQTLEFKSSFLYDFDAAKHGVEKANPALERAVLKEICAFLNSKGGTILVGISDDKKDGKHEVLGLSNDYKVLSVKKKDKDGFEVQLKNALNALEPKIEGLGLLEIGFDIKDGLDICIIEVHEADRETFLKNSMGGKEIKEFWIRYGNSTIQKEGTDLLEYIRKHWPRKS